MKITGDRGQVQIEDEGNIARFYGELCSNGFYADAGSILWLKKKGEATEEDRLNLIHKVIRHQQNDSFKILFSDDEGRLLFEEELGLKIQAGWPKLGYYVLMAAVLVGLWLPILLMEILDLADPLFRITFELPSVVLTGLILIFGFGIGRFRITAEGNRITVRPAAGRKYSFSVSEITKIVRRTDAADIWDVRKITIDTESKRVSVNSFMAGIEELDAYLIKHVGSEKIITKGFGK
ncbi:hypothetical protein B5E77_07845 [Lachnoclostridium sp. An131]|uniref:hypothetical protein n=1 Tax=Lachnoclostridium sp. An131 TaxID=1965555 RepID=UPI000B3A7F0C|nr:hypothetical protein [Lachnoclostridium sp. An131]OUQ27069.1 hypothetical protein B5E77_07845 [Lachnoclostridium sp. An131]